MKNKIVVITGASRGIGYATATEFTKAGYQVIGTSTTGESTTNIDIKQLNLSEEKSIETFCQNLIKNNLKIDCLINNAAIMIDQKETLVDMTKLRQTLEVNLIGTISLTEKLLPLMNNEGTIINLSSELGSLTQAKSNKAYSYRISKTAINMYTITLAQRLANQNIRVYSFAPGWVKTDMGTDRAPREAHEPAQEIFELCKSDYVSGKFYQGSGVRDW